MYFETNDIMPISDFSDQCSSIAKEVEAGRRLLVKRGTQYSFGVVSIEDMQLLAAAESPEMAQALKHIMERGREDEAPMLKDLELAPGQAVAGRAQSQTVHLSLSHHYMAVGTSSQDRSTLISSCLASATAGTSPTEILALTANPALYLSHTPTPNMLPITVHADLEDPTRLQNFRRQLEREVTFRHSVLRQYEANSTDDYRRMYPSAPAIKDLTLIMDRADLLLSRSPELQTVIAGIMEHDSMFGISLWLLGGPDLAELSMAKFFTRRIALQSDDPRQITKTLHSTAVAPAILPAFTGLLHEPHLPTPSRFTLTKPDVDPAPLRTCAGTWTQHSTEAITLGEAFDLAEWIQGDTRLRIPVGIFPTSMKRTPLPWMLDLSGNVLVMTSNTQRSTEFQKVTDTLMAAIALTTHPENVQIFYIGPTPEGPLPSGLPHISAAASFEEDDFVERILRKIRALRESREAVLATSGLNFAQSRESKDGASQELRAQLQSYGDHYGDIYLIVAGHSNRSSLGRHTPALAALAATGPRFGIHLILVADPATEGAYSNIQNLDVVVDFTKPTLDNFATVSGSELTALFAEPQLHRGPARPLEDIVEVARNNAAGSNAPSLDRLPTRLFWEGMQQPIAKEATRAEKFRITFGCREEDDLPHASADFGHFPHLLIVGERQSGKSEAIRTLIHGIAQQASTKDDAVVFLYDPRGVHQDRIPDTNLYASVRTEEQFISEMQRMIGELNLAKGRDLVENAAAAELNERTWWSGPEVFIVIDDYDLAIPRGIPSPVHELIGWVRATGFDRGIHVIIAMKSDDFATTMITDPIIKQMTQDLTPALLLSTDKLHGAYCRTKFARFRVAGRAIYTEPQLYRSALVQVAWVGPGNQTPYSTTASAIGADMDDTTYAERTEKADLPPWESLMRITDPSDLDVRAMWDQIEGSNDMKFLRVPIGFQRDGRNVELDLKEIGRGGEGPHGMLIGFPGSGKGEFLRNLALNLCATHSPELLNMVTVSHKGSDWLNELEDGPHIAGLLNNMDENPKLVRQFIDGTTQELQRRYDIVVEAAKKHPGENINCLFDYLRVRTNVDHGLQALPALLVIVEGFSELLEVHPELVQPLVGILRKSRSLGMHWLFVDETLGRSVGLEANVSYKIGLKTISMQDSRQLLGTDAAFRLNGEPGFAIIKSPARGLTQIRIAYSGRPYLPSPDADHHDGPVASVYDVVARQIVQAITERPYQVFEENPQPPKATPKRTRAPKASTKKVAAAPEAEPAKKTPAKKAATKSTKKQAPPAGNNLQDNVNRRVSLGPLSDEATRAIFGNANTIPAPQSEQLQPLSISELQPGDILKWKDKTMLVVGPGLAADPDNPDQTVPLHELLADPKDFAGAFRPSRGENDDQSRSPVTGE
ncbi:FtsK/SpoIIIE domain-containing protein [Mycobacteroides abscessus]|uniref:FtsK/SpoIIIE domain-containing protein n=1 Tax=Mycobacteroides abscessus TaxID=36809 RepID=UPI0009A7340A|nr:FtsK/SpoIIIE domain-containing protein [Mycobacteroides abscessus]SLH39130.1 cell division protein FtsK [Mycobacteroides abscessus subsp. massiliense]